MKRNIYFLTFILLTLAFSVLSTSAQPFEIKQAVVGTGGGTSSSGDGLLKLDSQIGQSAAKTDGSMGEAFNLRSGFWTPAPFAPSAAGVSISGRVISGKNSGMNNAIVTLTGGDITEPRTARTSDFGNFIFEDVRVGFFYVLTVDHKRYQFKQNIQTFMLFDDVRGLVFRSDM